MKLWKLRRWAYPDGGGEVVAAEIWPGAGGSSGRHAVLVDEARRAKNLKRCRGRARAQVRRGSRMAGMRYMWTLTFARAVYDYDQAHRLMAGFMRSRRARTVLGVTWCVVAELHPGGHGWHFHVAIPGWKLHGPVKAAWSEWLAGQGQPSPVTADGLVVVHVRDMGTSERVSGYLSKYITKSDDVPLGRHRYEFSANVEGRPSAEGRMVAASSVEVLRELIRQGVPVACAQIWETGEGPEGAEWEGPAVVATIW